MSWSKQFRVFTNTRVPVRKQIMDVEVEPQPASGSSYDKSEHDRQVSAAKEAAATLVEALQARPGKELAVSIGGHTCLDGQDWDSINVAISHADPIPAGK